MTRIMTIVLSLLSALTAAAQRKQCIDNDWHFVYGNGRAAVTNASVADGWRTLNLPHDWSVETEAARKAGGKVIGPFSSNSIGGYQTGHTVGGEGWYHKLLRVEGLELKDQRYVLYFEGAYYQSRVYVNGKEANFCPYGYSSFRVDVTSLLHEGNNNIVVQVKNEGNNTRWYSGSGIYRHVWLIQTPKVYLDEWDTFVEIKNEKLTVKDGLCSGEICVQTLVHNETGTAINGSVSVDFIDAAGTTVATASQPIADVAQPSTLNIQLSNAHTWSPTTPYIYKAVISVKDETGNVIDSFEKRVGLRTLEFSAQKGFLLNGVNTLLRGGCVHHDNGMLGAAAFDKAERRKLQLLKNQGYNAVRCSHNLPSENFLNLCDELGLMVIDECFDQWYYQKNNDDYHNYFAEWSDRDVTDMVRRDRNHPSIIMWSIGNEIPGRIEPAGIAAAERLRKDILQYDTTRPITAAICGWDAGDAWNSAGGNWDAQSSNAFKSLDVGGYNYMYDKYEYDHSHYPDRVMCGLESYPKLASENWNLVEKHPYVIGDFVWTAMDYLGEAGIGAAYSDQTPSMFQSWPWFNGYCGDLDLIGQKKPQSYYRDVVWREAPVTMAVMTTPSYNNAWGWQLEEQCWTYPGMEGQNVSINVYSRAAKVRLYLNDVSQGDHVPGHTFWTGYNIAYQPGTLRVVNLDAKGNQIAGEEFVLKTTGKASGIRFVYDDGINTLTSDLQDLCYVTIELVDEEGNVVTADKETQIHVSNEGVGELIGCCTACPDDMKSFRTLSPRVFRGRALAIVRSNGVAGKVKLKAEIVEKQENPMDKFLKNASFQNEDLENWVVSDGKYIAYNTSVWHESKLDGFLEFFVGWGTASTLAKQSVAQSTKVLPEGEYTVAFDYNGTVLKGGKHYATDGTLSGVTVSMGGQTLELKDIDAHTEKHATFSFKLNEPKAVTFLLQFANNTNADWFALDNVSITYTGSFNFDQSYIDCTSAVPTFGDSNWTRQSGNAAGADVETKLSSAVYDGAGLAFWTASVPRNCDLFRQDITHLPAGRYGIAAFCAANKWSSSDNDRNHQPGTYFFAKTNGSSSAETEVTTASYGLYSLVVNVEEGETLTLGMRASSSNGNNWCYLSGITLVQIGASSSTGIKETKSEALEMKHTEQGVSK